MKHLLVIFFSIIFTLLGYCQTEEDNEINWIPEISTIRDFILLNNPDEPKALKQLFEKWAEYGTTAYDWTSMTFNILKASAVDGNDFDRIQKRALKSHPNSKISMSLTAADVDVIVNNAELLHLIHLGLLESKYPFEIDLDGGFLQELNEYGLNSKDNIGEIGCGEGSFGTLIYTLQPEIELHLNELDKSFLKYLRLRLTKNQSLIDSNNINLIKGKAKSTNLEGSELNKIILRNTFHHIEKKAEMLLSIKESMTLDGMLYILESVTELDNDGHICKDAIQKNKIVEIIESNGFTLMSETILNESVLLQFKKK